MNKNQNKEFYMASPAGPVCIEMQEYPLRYPIITNIPSYDMDYVSDIQGLTNKIFDVFMESKELSRKQQGEAFSLINKLRNKMFLDPFILQIESDSYFNLAIVITTKKKDLNYNIPSAQEYIKAFNEITNEFKKRSIDYIRLGETIKGLSICHDKFYFDILLSGICVKKLLQER